MVHTELPTKEPFGYEEQEVLGRVDHAEILATQSGEELLLLRGCFACVGYSIKSLRLGAGVGGLHHAELEAPSVDGDSAGFAGERYIQFSARVALGDEARKASEIPIRFVAKLDSDDVVRGEFTLQLADIHGARHAVRVNEPGPDKHAKPAGRLDGSGVWRAALRNFLSSNRRLALPAVTEPLVSVIVPLHNRAEDTYACITSLVAQRGVQYEVILVDNASTDSTPQLLERIDGATCLRNESNEHFLRAVNQAASVARGEYLLILNSDTYLLSGCVERAVRTLREDATIGALGGRILAYDGRLQEAGQFLWRDGASQGYGAGEPPDRPAFQFLREVDYCSAAFLITPRSLFSRLAGFDSTYEPAYYEDVDYCLRVWESGRRVVYDPRIVVIHNEHSSAISPDEPKRLMTAHRNVLASRHAAYLARRPQPGQATARQVRWSSHTNRPAVLFVCDEVPHRLVGDDVARRHAIVRALDSLGYRVTIVPTSQIDERTSEMYRDIPRTIEILPLAPRSNLVDLLHAIGADYRLLFVSGIPNLRDVNLYRWRNGARTPVIFDVARLPVREVLERSGPVSHEDAEVSRTLSTELRELQSPSLIFAASPSDIALLKPLEAAPTALLSYGSVAIPDPLPAHSRRRIVTAGNLGAPGSPALEALRYVKERVAPLMKTENAQWSHLGAHKSSAALGQTATGIEFLGISPALGDVFSGARVFVAADTFGTFLPPVAIDAAAHGVPIVCSPQMAEHFGWAEGTEFLVARNEREFAEAIDALFSDEALWTNIQAAALARVRADYVPQEFVKRLQMGVESFAGPVELGPVLKSL